MATYYPQGSFVIVDHDPYDAHSSRPAFVLSDDKHPDRYDEQVADPSYTATLLTTGFYADNAWSLKVGYQDLAQGKALARRDSYLMLWAVRPIYESEIAKRVAQASDEFLREVGAAYQRFLDPSVSRL